MRNVYDIDLNKYSVPEDMVDQFYNMMDEITRHETASDNWFDAVEAFLAIFKQYLVIE